MAAAKRHRHDASRSIVLYAAGSPLVADVEETCRRLGVVIAAAVKNFPGEHYLVDASLVREAVEIDPSLLRIPCIVALFTPTNRGYAVKEAIARGFPMAQALIDPTAIVASSTTIGPGSYVNAGAVIGAAGRIGAYVVVNRAGSVGHHAEIEDMVSLGPGVVIAGMVRLGRGAMIGAGATILPRIEIGEDAVIGAGAVVTRNIPAGALAIGNPAKIMRRRRATPNDDEPRFRDGVG